MSSKSLLLVALTATIAASAMATEVPANKRFGPGEALKILAVETPNNLRGPMRTPVYYVGTDNNVYRIERNESGSWVERRIVNSRTPIDGTSMRLEKIPAIATPPAPAA